MVDPKDYFNANRNSKAKSPVETMDLAFDVEK